MKIDTIEKADDFIRKYIVRNHLYWMDNYKAYLTPDEVDKADSIFAGFSVQLFDYYLNFYRATNTWYLSKEIYDPGVRYHKDGSGTPPSSDIVTVDESKDFYMIFNKLITLIIKDGIDVFIENEQMQEAWEDKNNG